MFKKQKRTQENYFEDFGMSSSNSQEKISVKSSRSRFSHLQKGTLLRKSFEKSISSKKMAPRIRKKFNDYGFDSKAPPQDQTNALYPHKVLRSQNKELAPRQNKDMSEKKVEKIRKDYIKRKIIQRSQENQRIPIQRKTEPQPCSNDGENVISPRKSLRTIYSPKLKQIKHNLVNISTQYDRSQAQRCINERVKFLQKSVSEYYELYTACQNRLEEQRRKTEEQRKKCEIIKELYRQRFQIIVRKEGLKKNTFGHLFSYKQFPKDFIPEQIITELIGESEQSYIKSDMSNSEGQLQCSSLSLISH